MRFEDYQPQRGFPERVAEACGWLSFVFFALFVMAFLLFLTGFGDLREGGELGMLAFAVTVPPALFFGFIWLGWRVCEKLSRNNKGPTSGSSEPGGDAPVGNRNPVSPGR